MTSRAHPAVLSGYSLEADASLNLSNLARMQAAIVSLLAKHGAMTHDELIDAYGKRAESTETIPFATDQSIRTRTSELVHRGLVRAAADPGRSRHGRRATRWVLA
ncbi:hypothetical protein [Microbacterium plantarum]|uniref:Uncharacterized protein n=1 Tax=Microbacterium plantarum TaxID=1816425 RepID=A0ABV5EUD5_9MICO